MSKQYLYVIKEPTGELMAYEDGLAITFTSALEALMFRGNTVGCVVYSARSDDNGDTFEVIRWPHRNQTEEHELASLKLGRVLAAMPRGIPLPEGWEVPSIAAGLLMKKDLVDGAYYYGKCRNAKIARWDAQGTCYGWESKFGSNVRTERKGRFVHIRHKFGATFPESINHPEDDNGYDFFIPVAQVQPSEAERVTDESLRNT